jgi:D-3-phosphoglycerate dehydrogenase
MKGKILVTDSLFIGPEHEKVITDAGYEIERLDKPEATEEELIAAVPGKVGYILGGIEEVTQKVIDAADQLKAIVFTGIGYKEFITAWEYAKSKNVAIANTPDAPTHAVAEWAITVALAMNRGIFELGPTGDKRFLTTKGLEGQRIGIIGLGRIGKHIAEMLAPFRTASISYWSKHRQDESSFVYQELDTLLAGSDIIFLCVSKDAGDNFIGEKELARMKEGALIIMFGRAELVNEPALLKELQGGRIRAASDNTGKDKAFKELPLSHWFRFSASNAFNTSTELKLTSDTATKSLLNLLETGKDEFKVN